MRVHTGLVIVLERSPGLLSSERNPLLHASDAVQCRSDIKREDWGTVRLVRRRIVVDHVADFLAGALAFDDPVVTIEWGFRATRERDEDE